MSASVAQSGPGWDLTDSRHRTYGLKTAEEHIKAYDEWAISYNEDVMGDSTGYVGPTQTLQAVLNNNGRLSGEILDAGCGTGLTGVALASKGATSVDGIDLSPGMLRIARQTGKYRELAPADMLKPLNLPSEKYDVVTCVGTFTTGHVGPNPAFSELLRVMKHGGLFVATVLDNIWVSDGFEAEVERLKQSGTVQVVSTEIKDYRLADQAKARMVVLKKN